MEYVKKKHYFCGDLVQQTTNYIISLFMAEYNRKNDAAVRVNDAMRSGSSRGSLVEGATLPSIETLRRECDARKGKIEALYALTDRGDYVERSYETSRLHGFHDEEWSVEHYLMLILSEVGEAVEADRRMKRANLLMFDANCTRPQPKGRELSHWAFCFDEFVKDTLEDELADVCIRLYDLCGVYNEKPKFADEPLLWAFTELPFEDNAYYLCSILCGQCDESFATFTGLCLSYVYSWSIALGFDLKRHIDLKMRYNASRPKKHGKKY